MASARTAWGIDIGNRALKAIKLVREGTSVRVEDFEIIEHEQVLSNAGDNRESLVTAALANFVQRRPTKGVPVAIGVSGQQSFARFIKLPPVEPRKIPEIVRFEAIQQIPFPLDDVEWSYQLFQSPDSPDVEVGIFAMRKELVDQHIKYFTDVDLNVQAVQMSPLAVYNAMAFDGRIKETTMLIDLGAENTDLIIADGQTVWLRSIPIGGNNFTESLVKSFKLNFAKAEDLKRNAATSKYARQIFQAMRPVFADLVSEIQRSIGFYSSVHRDSRIQKVIALGATFRLPGLQKYLQQNLQLEVERLDSLGAGMPAADGRSGANFSENALSMVTAYGLALQALGEGRIESSLLPAAIRRAKMWKEKTKWFSAAAALIVLGTGVAYGRLMLTESQTKGAQESSAGPIRDVQGPAKQLSDEWDAVESAGSGDRQQLKDLASLLKYRALWTTMLSDIYGALPQAQADTKRLQATMIDGLLTNDKAKIMSVARDQRRLVVLDDIRNVYIANLSGELASKPGAGAAAAAPAAPAGGAGAGASAAPAGPRGFVFTLSGTTPNKGGYDFITSQFKAKLEAHRADEPDPTRPDRWIAPTKGFYVEKVTLESIQQIRENQSRLSALNAAFSAARSAAAALNPGNTRGPGMDFGDRDRIPPRDFTERTPFGVNPAGGAGGTGAVVNEAYNDRVTGEDVRSDWAFTLKVVVVLDPPPKPAAKPAAE